MVGPRATDATVEAAVRMAGVLGVVVGIAFVVAACGDNGDDDNSTATEAAAASADNEVEVDDPESAVEPGSMSTGEASAVVVLDGETYEFEPEVAGFCVVDENGIFHATIASGTSGVVEVSLPPDGYEADSVLSYADEYASVDVVLPDGAEWSADAYESDPESTNNLNIPPGLTQVDSFEFDDSGASGSATFLNMEDLTYEDDGTYSGEPITGTFEVVCG